MKIRGWHIGAAGLIALYIAWKRGAIDLTSFGLAPAILGPGAPQTIDTSFPNFVKLLLKGILGGKSVQVDSEQDGAPGNTGGQGGAGGTTGSGQGSGQSSGACATLLSVPFYATWLPGTKQEFLQTVYFDQRYQAGNDVQYRGEPTSGNWQGYKVTAAHQVICNLINQGKVAYQPA